MDVVRPVKYLVSMRKKEDYRREMEELIVVQMALGVMLHFHIED